MLPKTAKSCWLCRLPRNSELCSSSAQTNYSPCNKQNWWCYWGTWKLPTCWCFVSWSPDHGSVIDKSEVWDSFLAGRGATGKNESMFNGALRQVCKIDSVASNYLGHEIWNPETEKISLGFQVPKIWKLAAFYFGCKLGELAFLRGVTFWAWNCNQS